MNSVLCNEFIKNDNINPITKRKIKKNGPTYKKLIKQCERISDKEKIKTQDKSAIESVKKNYNTCKKMIKDDSKNPFTGRKIKRNGPTYNRILSECEDIQEMYNIYKKFKNNKAVKSSLVRINTSVRKIIRKENELSPSLIVKQKTKKVRDNKIEGGTIVIELLMIYYLVRKFSGKLNFLIDTDFTEALKSINNQVVSKKELVESVNLGMYLFFNRYGETDRFSKLYTIHNDKKVFPSLKKSSKRFSIVLLTLVITIKTDNNKKLAHANALIYDKKTNTVYRFEPHGQTKKFDSSLADRVLSEYFEQFKIKYENLSSFCPLVKGMNVGPQTLEKYTGIKVEGDPVGFCSYWTTYFLDFLLTNYNKPQYKDKSVGELLEIMIDNISKKFSSFTDFIRTYAVFFNEIYLNIGKGKNINRLIDITIKDL